MRYSLLRLLTFFAVLLLLWLVGLRGMLLLVIAMVASAIISLFALQGPREDFARTIEGKVAERRAREDQHRVSDEEVEDVD